MCARAGPHRYPTAPVDDVRRAACVSRRRDRTLVGHVRPTRRASSRPVRHVRVRPRHLRPGDVVALARARSVRHGARARGVRASRQRDPVRARALLPIRRGPAFLVARADRRAGERRVRGVPARARSSRRPMARARARRRLLAAPDVAVARVGVLPSRCGVDRTAVVRVLGVARTSVGVVRRRGDRRGDVQGRRRARARRDRSPHRVPRRPPDRIRGQCRLARLVHRRDPGGDPVAERDRAVLRQLLRHPRNDAVGSRLQRRAAPGRGLGCREPPRSIRMAVAHGGAIGVRPVALAVESRDRRPDARGRSPHFVSLRARRALPLLGARARRAHGRDRRGRRASPRSLPAARSSV